MRWPSRRHRGSQVGIGAPVITMPSDVDPQKTAQTLGFLAERRIRASQPAPVLATARQVLTASLLRDELLAWEPDHVETLVKGIMLDLDEAGLTIVASGEVE